MDSNHNNAVYIAHIVCAYCEAGKLKHQCLFPTPGKIERTYQVFHAMGARKGFLEDKLKFLTRCNLHVESNFVMVAEFNIELVCRYQGGLKKHWNGKGNLKNGSFEQTAEMWRMSEEAGMGGCPIDGFLQFQIDITPIWNEISPYLDH